MKTIITAALTGAVAPKSKNPHIPCTPREIAEDGIRCWKAGASILHLHMRDDQFRGTMDKNRFRETVNILRQECDAILNLTTSGELGVDDERRMEHVAELLPEMATFDAGTINPNDGIFENSVEFLTKLGKMLIELGVKPEVEIMDLGFISAAQYYVSKGVLLSPVHYQFVLGFGFSGAPATPENLLYMKSKIPADSTWSAFGTGSAHLPIMYTTIAAGGHVRVGLEDNIYYAPGVLATNEMLVQRAARVISEFGNEVATPAEAREILGLKGSKGVGK
jgi:3-keto-5-aminohexanoate cleavage enzyme